MNREHSTFIRHAESVGNAGGTSASSATIPLTERGRAQAERAAREYVGPAPDLIVVSPYLRTEQTARPFLRRFPAARVERWPVYEFTFLNEERYRGTTSAQRRPATREYWRRGDPHWVDGPGAESFAQFIGRIRDALERLRAVPHARVLIFTHETAMKAALWLNAAAPGPVTTAMMRRFHKFMSGFDIPNLGRWKLRRPKALCRRARAA